MSDRARGHQWTPRWLRFMTQHERWIEFLLFGAFFLGLGTLLAVAWVFLLIGSVSGEWGAFGEFLEGGVIAVGAGAVGWIWLWRRAQDRRSRM